MAAPEEGGILREGRGGSVLSAWVSASWRGASAGFIGGTLASFAFTVLYIVKRQYLFVSLRHAYVHLALYPLFRVLPAAAGAGLLLGILVVAAGPRRRRPLLALAAAVGFAGAVLLLRARFPLFVPRPLLKDSILVVGSVMLGGAAWLAARPIDSFVRRIPFGRLTAAAGIPVLCLLAAAFLGDPCDRLVSHKEYGERRLLALFDRRAPGMEEVFRHADRGDTRGAMEALAEHFRTRPLPPLLSPLAPATDAEMREAGRAMRHVFSMGGLERELGSRIDWTGSDVQDREYAYNLNRHPQWNDLARAYLRTGEERYAAEVAAQLHDWVDRTEPLRWKREATSPSWRLLECALRLRDSWIPAAAALRSSPDLDARFWIDFLGSVHDQAQFVSFFRSDANHFLMESVGLLETSVHFPEFRRAAVWRKIALERISQQTRLQVYPDGVHVELSPAYHRMVLEEFTRGLEVIRLHRLEPPRDLPSRIEAMWEYLSAIVRPDGQIPNLNDGAPTSIAADLTSAASVFGREDFLYAGTAGSEGAPPSWLSRLFPDAGQVVMRTGWEAQDLYLVFDAGAFGGPHGHEDKLSIVCSAYGRPLLVDPGSFTYDPRSFFRRYFLSSFAHSTVVVDGLGQARQRISSSYRYIPAPRPFWQTGSGGEFAEGAYDQGYADPGDWSVPPDRAVRHTRGILFVRPDYWVVLDRLEGSGTHECARLFHFAPGPAAAMPGGAATRNAEGGNLAILAGDGARASLRDGWFSRGYNAREPAPVLILENESALPFACAAVLFPFAGNAAPLPAVTSTPLPGGGIGIAVTRAEGEDLILWPPPRAGAWSWRGIDAGKGIRVALVRRDAAGEVRAAFVGGSGRATADGPDLR